MHRRCNDAGSIESAAFNQSPDSVGCMCSILERSCFRNPFQNLAIQKLLLGQVGNRTGTASVCSPAKPTDRRTERLVYSQPRRRDSFRRFFLSVLFPRLFRHGSARDKTPTRSSFFPTRRLTFSAPLSPFLPAPLHVSSLEWLERVSTQNSRHYLLPEQPNNEGRRKTRKESLLLLKKKENSP